MLVMLMHYFFCLGYFLCLCFCSSTPLPLIASVSGTLYASRVYLKGFFGKKLSNIDLSDLDITNVTFNDIEFDGLDLTNVITDTRVRKGRRCDSGFYFAS